MEEQLHRLTDRNSIQFKTKAIQVRDCINKTQIHNRVKMMPPRLKTPSQKTIIENLYMVKQSDENLTSK